MGNPFDNVLPAKDTSALEAELATTKSELEASKGREQQLLDQLLVTPTPPVPPKPVEGPPKPPEPPKPAPVEGGEFDTLVLGARTLVRADHPDFDKFASEIDAIVTRMAPEFRKQYRVWLEVYFNVRGRHTDDLIAADRTARATPAPGERPTSPPAPASEDHVTDPVEHDMMTKLGFTEKQWIERRKKMEGGKWELNLG
jgi:hypothetical protein